MADSGPAHVPAPPALVGIKVLVVDDDVDVLHLVKLFLANARAEVATAASVDDALAALDTFKPDVILSDIDMPACDGYELMRMVRRRSAEAGGTTPSIALTAHAMDSDRDKALAAGYDEHVAKPMRAAHLIAAIVEVLGRRRGAG